MNEAGIISNFYAFSPFEASELSQIRIQLKEFAIKEDLRGLIILAPEGCNGSIWGSNEGVLAFEKYLLTLLSPSHCNDIFKRAYAPKAPFRKFVVKLKKEIITSGAPELTVKEGLNALPAEEWEGILNSEEPFLLVDTRNSAETGIGMFKGATTLDINHFSQFKEAFLEKNVPHQTKVLLYCTGGIRCEKALPLLEQEGYKNIFQLQGGILKYLETFPNRNFSGECFVFDYRVAVDQNLNPSQKYNGWCDYCSNPLPKDREHSTSRYCAGDVCSNRSFHQPHPRQRTASQKT
jgi:UPF0176 protein